MNLDGAMRDVDDPVVEDPGARIEPRLEFAIGAIGALRDLDDQNGVGGMCVLVRARVEWHHTDVRLRLRVVVERDRQLRIDLPGAAECVTKRGDHPTNGGSVPAALWLSHDQEAVEQLEAFVRPEHTELDQAIVLDTRPAPGPGELGDGERHQNRSVASPAGPVNVLEPARLSPATERA